MAALKARIAAKLGRAPGGLRLRKGERGAHLKDEDTALLGEGGAGLTDGGAVYVEEGAPLRAGEVWTPAPILRTPAPILRTPAPILRTPAPICACLCARRPRHRLHAAAATTRGFAHVRSWLDSSTGYAEPPPPRLQVLLKFYATVSTVSPGGGEAEGAGKENAPTGVVTAAKSGQNEGGGEGGVVGAAEGGVGGAVEGQEAAVTLH